LLGSGGEPVCVPYHLTSYRIENGQFLLFVPGSTKPAMRENPAGANFFPGLVLLNWIYASYQAPQSSADLASRVFRIEKPSEVTDERITRDRQTGAVTPELPGVRGGQRRLID
jgi:hypothetical protein